ncbi:hypothetical protein [Arthrobacter zhaoguopingii]|uniref:hypothetical protein n=1 Tax=Arthrobacter zhaoguopingii TaxID=2681491 RepID=UPI0019159F2F|nr:hypothetical protein [Arthrobacter zhaoguopingii]
MPQEQILDYSFVLSDDSVGAPVQYVVDPEDESYFIAMGRPSEWEDNPWARIGSLIFAVVATLVFIAVASGRIIPEDVEAAA